MEVTWGECVCAFVRNDFGRGARRDAVAHGAINVPVRQAHRPWLRFPRRDLRTGAECDFSFLQPLASCVATRDGPAKRTVRYLERRKESTRGLDNKN